MRHPTDGTLRRLVDEPDGVPDVDRRHVAACPSCLSGLAAARADSAAASAVLGPPAGVGTAAATAAPAADADPDVDAAWQRLSRRLVEEPAGGRVRAAVPARRRRRALRSPVVAALGAAALLTGAGAAAATDWLQVFRAERVAPVAVTQAELVQLPDLSAYGTLEVVQQADVEPVADAAAAEAATGLAVPEVDALPRGVAETATYQVGDEVRAEFTFSAEQAARAAAAAGETLPPPPDGLDGTRFRRVAGPGVAAVWPGQSGLPAMVVARAVAPTAFSTGVDFEVARDYLLGLPGLPDELAAQLRGVDGTGTTLPLPVPAEEATTASADVGGAPATVVTTRDGTLAAVVWVEEGVVTAVAGSLSADEVLAVARGLR